MKNIVAATLATFFILQTAVANEPTDLKEVTVWGSRALKSVGAQETQIDSAALKNNIALSLADVLAFNSSLFVKNYGRATVSTVSLRGTSAAHTQVVWNGLSLNDPMMGTTDFSTIPSFLIDRARVLHGPSSVSETAGGLGGMVNLSSVTDIKPGINFKYIQGLGSFNTFDQFLLFGHASPKLKLETRASYSTSKNDFKYINRDKKENILDADNNIIGQYYPTERNKSGQFKDFNVLQQAVWQIDASNRLKADVWLAVSTRGLPLMTTDYSDEQNFENQRHECNLRAVVGWSRYADKSKSELSAAFQNLRSAYDYRRETVPGIWADMTHSRTRATTAQLSGKWQYTPRKQWLFDVMLSSRQHTVYSRDKNVVSTEGGKNIVGYDNARAEGALSASARWQPSASLGTGVTMRQEIMGKHICRPIPAAFADLMILPSGMLMAKASASRNIKSPSLNDLYFLPGGNPDLKDECAWTYDAGLSFNSITKMPFNTEITCSTTWFDSYIDNWILWLPTTKGFYSPRNVKRVHSYGIESKLFITTRPFKNAIMDLSATYAWTPSVNMGPRMSDADKSVGKQLPYIPRHSATLTARFKYQTWGLTYNWAYYSKRHTMTDNDKSLTGELQPYFMSNITLEQNLFFKPIDIQLKLTVNNIFNEEYVTVLSRPMPGINFEFFVALTPKFNRKPKQR